MRNNGDQNEVFAFLSALAAQPGARGSRIDTHAASVFLIDDKAYKIKQAVRFPFLDYSTLEKRRLACEAELRINRPFAPSIYASVKPITRVAGEELVLGGDGDVVEWALEMNRFDETKTLDHVVPTHLFDDAAADQLGRIVADMHRKATPANAETWFAALASFIVQNTAALKERSSFFEKGEVEAFDGQCHDRLLAAMPVLRARAQRNLVRRCHGDLHLANIVMLDGKPLPFDAIEFDDTVASGDVMYDLAFLLMDLIKFGAAHAATIVLNRYLVETVGNDDGLATLPLFMAVRAAIRAHVTAAKIERAATGERADIADRARAYFALARRLIDPPPPALIAIGGLSGAGKSVLARALASYVKPEPGAVVLRSDVERKVLAGVRETHVLPPQSYTREASDRLYAHLREKAAEIVKKGHSVIVDAVHASPDERHAIEKVAKAAGARFHGLFLTADIQTREERVERRTHDASDATVTVVRQQQNYTLGDIGWTSVDASGSPPQTLKKAEAVLFAKR